MLKKLLSAPLSLSFSGILVIGCYSSYSVAKQSSDLKQRSWISRYNEFEFEWRLIRNFSFLDEGCSGLALHEPHCNYHNNIPDLTEVILGIRILTNETAAASARFCDCVWDSWISDEAIGIVRSSWETFQQPFKVIETKRTPVPRLRKFNKALALYGCHSSHTCNEYLLHTHAEGSALLL